MVDKKLKIIISVGDELGIGPEIILKALGSFQLKTKNEIIVVGCKRNLISTYKLLKSYGIQNIANPEKLIIKNVNVINNFKDQPEAYSGNASFQYLKYAINIVKSYSNAALVTGPICKKSWALAGHNYSGQTELLAESCNASNVGMLFTAKSPYTGWRFNTLLATTHLSLSDISKNLNEKLIINKLDLLLDFSKKFNQEPKLKVAGLNPHAGEEGLLGTEEEEWMKYTLSKWAENNPTAKLEGPISPDSCWLSSAKAWKEKKAPRHDGILAMYHDQGLIPMKVIASNYSVNTTLGLPFIRTSPDHGTGFDIAGKGIAQCQRMIEAIKTATDLSISSRSLYSH